MEKISLDRDAIIEVIRELSFSQGFYGRVLNAIVEMREYAPEEYEEYMTMLEEQNFHSPLDVVYFFEC